MDQDKKLEKAIALIIACTRRVKRPKDIMTLAQNISYAKQHLGSLKKVAEAVRLSVQQLNDFLAVEELCSEVKSLVAKRTIDSVDVVKTISKLPKKKQKILAEHFISGKITSKDVRVIATFAKKFSGRSMEKVIRDYEKSRDVRLYVAQFRLPASFNNSSGLRKQFEKIVGKNEMKKLQIKGKVAVLEITATGHKNLREAVKKRKMSLRKFIESTVVELGERK